MEGLVILRRLGQPILSMLAVAAVMTIIAVTFYGAVRFRVPADVAIVVCAAIALDAAWARFAPSTRPLCSCSRGRVRLAGSRSTLT